MHKQLGVAGIAGMALLLVLSASGASERVGVAAAVNQDASRTPPGASARTVILGDNLIFRERIETRGDGLVQILLVDGSTFTVGANSDLVIDEFVYDPDTGTGRLVASFGKGVARFVGGKLSKTAGGVTVKTPVGTIGIRGGIANLNVRGEESRFSLLFGDELSFIGKNGEQSRIYERGYTLSVAAALSGSLERPVVRRTTQADIGGVQTRAVRFAGAVGRSPDPADRPDGRPLSGGQGEFRPTDDQCRAAAEAAGGALDQHQRKRACHQCDQPGRQQRHRAADRHAGRRVDRARSRALGRRILQSRLRDVLRDRSRCPGPARRQHRRGPRGCLHRRGGRDADHRNDRRRDARHTLAKRRRGGFPGGDERRPRRGGGPFTGAATISSPSPISRRFRPRF